MKYATKSDRLPRYKDFNLKETMAFAPSLTIARRKLFNDKEKVNPNALVGDNPVFFAIWTDNPDDREKLLVLNAGDGVKVDLILYHKNEETNYEVTETISKEIKAGDNGELWHDPMNFIEIPKWHEYTEFEATITFTNIVLDNDVIVGITR